MRCFHHRHHRRGNRGRAKSRAFPHSLKTAPSQDPQGLPPTSPSLAKGMPVTAGQAQLGGRSQVRAKGRAKHRGRGKGRACLSRTALFL